MKYSVPVAVGVFLYIEDVAVLLPVILVQDVPALSHDFHWYDNVLEADVVVPTTDKENSVLTTVVRAATGWVVIFGTRDWAAEAVFIIVDRGENIITAIKIKLTNFLLKLKNILFIIFFIFKLIAHFFNVFIIT